MASADIDGFRIRIDDTLARDISKIDKALQNIEIHGDGAAYALTRFKAGLAGMRGFEGDVGAVASYLEKIKTAMKNMPVKNLNNVANSLSAITQNVNSMSSDKLQTMFANAESPAAKIFQLVNNMAVVLAGLSGTAFKDAITAASQAQVAITNAQAGVTTKAPISTSFDPQEVDRSAQNLSSTLNAYLQKHPIQVKLQKPTPSNMAEFDQVRKDLEAKFQNLQVTLATSVVKSVTQGATTATQQTNRVVQQSAAATQDALSESKINALWTERARLIKEIVAIITRKNILEKEGGQLSLKEVQSLDLLRQRHKEVVAALQKQEAIQNDAYNFSLTKGRVKLAEAEVAAERNSIKEFEKAEKEKTKVAEREAKRRADIQSRWNDRRYQNYISSTGYAEQFGQRAIRTGTYEDTAKGIKLLQNAMAKVKPNSDEWNRMNVIFQQLKQNADKYRQSLEGIKNRSLNLMPTLKNLAMQLGIVFSVQQLGQWIKHMTEVRAQFELQNIALRSIIQDKQKADEVFAQVQQLALKSPFSIMQLNTYTKQIAAYGVEAEKLVGTTKMLADVSAGLGVDMGRLILAFGQVKTANYLRATEVRQFTEAGLNITQELANYFTELNGKMVTAGEVTEMITKRMVKFEDVAEVFERVTSAGGMFYDMQEKQAEGIHGQIRRIGDAYAMMLNDIGKSNEGIIVWTLAAIRELIQNWRTFAPIVKSVVVAFASFHTARGIVGLIPLLRNVWAGFALVTAEMRAATGALATLRAGLSATNTLIGTMGWVGLAAAIGSAVYAMTQASSTVSQLEEDLERMRREIIIDVADSIGRFQELASVIQDQSTSYDKQKEAVDELKRAYGDILPSEMLEIENIQKMGKEYGQATEAIREYYRTKLYEEQKSRVEADAASMFSSASKDIVEDAVDKLEKYGASKSTVQKIMNGIIAQAKSGAITGAKEIAQAFVDAIGKYYNTSVRMDTSSFELLAGAVTAYQNEIAALDTTVIEFETHEEELEHEAMQKTAKAFEEQKAKVEALTNALKELYSLRVRQDRKVQQGGTLDTSDAIELEKATKSVKDAYAALGDKTNATSEGIKNVTSSMYNLDVEISRVTHSIYGKFIKGLSDTREKSNALANNKYLQTWVQGLQREIDAVDGTPVQKEIRKIEKALSELYNVDLGTFDWLKTDIKTSFSSAAKEVKGKIDEIKEQVLQFKTIVGMSIFPDPIKHAENVTGMTKEEYDRASKTIEMYTKLWNAIGGHDKEKKTKGGDKTEQLLRNRVNLLKEANQMYEKLRKEYNDEIAAQMTYNNLLRQAKDLKIDSLISDKDFTNKGTLADMEALSKMFNYGTAEFKKKYANAWNELMKQIGDQRFQMSVDINKESRDRIAKELDKMMDGYQLYIELDKMGVGDDIKKLLFDIDPKDIEEIKKSYDQLWVDYANSVRRQTEESFTGFANITEAMNSLGVDSRKQYEDGEKKVTDAYKKELESRMKEYTKYLKKSYSESVNIQVEAYTELERIRKDFAAQELVIKANVDLSPEVKSEKIKDLETTLKQITDKIHTDMNEKLGKAMFESFKGSEIYTEMFGDLDKVGKLTINALIAKINELKGHMESLSPKQIKELAQYEEKLFAAKAERNPFGEYLKALKEVNAIRKEGWTYDKLDAAITEGQAKIDEYDAEIDRLQTILAAKEKNLDITKEATIWDEQSRKLVSQSISDVKKELDTKQKEKKTEEQALKTNLKRRTAYKQLATAEEKSIKKAQEWGELAHKSVGVVRKSMEALKGSINEEDEAFLDMADNIVECTVQAISFALSLEAVGLAAKSAMGIIGYILIALESIVGILSAISKAHDARLERRIEREKGLVDRLKKSYEDLSDAIENAFSGHSLAINTQDAIENIKKQNESYKKMIQLEKDKKHADYDKIKEWEDAIHDNLKEIEKLQADYVSKLGGLGTGSEVLDAATNFVDAWADAFADTGDGLSGLRKNFDDFMRNIVKKQASLKIADLWINKFGNMINEAFNESGSVNMDKLVLAMEWFTRDAMPAIDSSLQSLDKMWRDRGLGGIADIGSDLSGLAAGIQGVTEETAQIVEAMLNSMRYFVSDTNQVVHNIFNAIANPLEENPFLKELKSQTRELQDIHKTLKSIIRGGHRQGGSGIKVFQN